MTQDKLKLEDVFSKITLTDKKDLIYIKEQYNARCDQVFKTLNTDKEYLQEDAQFDSLLNPN